MVVTPFTQPSRRQPVGAARVTTGAGVTSGGRIGAVTRRPDRLGGLANRIGNEALTLRPGAMQCVAERGAGGVAVMLGEAGNRPAGHLQRT